MKIQSIITATVAIILVCLVAIPIIDATSTSLITEENNTTYRYMATDDGKRVEISISDSTWTVNGFVIDDSSKVILADTVIISQGSSSSQNAYIFNGSAENTIKYGYLQTIVFENGNFTITRSDGGSFTGTYSWVVYPSQSGDQGLFDNNLHNTTIADEYYIPIRGYSYTVDNVTYSISASISVKNGSIADAHGFMIITPGSESPITVPLSISNFEVVEPELSEDGLSYVISSQNITFSYSDETYSINTNMNNTRMYAPISYEMMTENNQIIHRLVDLIPVLLIVAIVIGIGYSIARRD